MTRKINSIVLHHAAINNNGPQAETVDRYHRSKWLRPGYHYFIERSPKGELVEMYPLRRIAYHSGNFNNNSIGICLAGDFRFQEPTKAQIVTLTKLLIELQREYKIRDERIFLHKEVGNTSCPIVDLRQMYFVERQNGPESALESTEKPWEDKTVKRKIARLRKLIRSKTGITRKMLARQLERLAARVR